ncbi:MAG: hypothetical protein U1E73_11480 [Planctomycetota bacterium]
MRHGRRGKHATTAAVGMALAQANDVHLPSAIVFVLLASVPQAQALRDVDVPAAIRTHACFDPVRGRVVLMGTTSLFELRAGQWSRLPTAMPPSHADLQLVAGEGARSLWAVGSPDIYAPAEVWQGDGTDWQLVATPTGPVVNFTCVAYDDSRHELVTFGGYSGAAGMHDQTWVWNGSAWARRFPPVSPPSSMSGAMAYDPSRQRVVLVVGGQNPTASETWEWDGVQWTPIATAVAPPPRSDAGMAYDLGRARMVLVGGRGPSVLDDCWEYDGANWTQQAAMPAARGAPVVCYDAVGGRTLVMLGADDAFSRSDVFAWNGAAWSVAPDFGVAPSGRPDAAIAVEPGGGSVLLYGGGVRGQTPNYLADTWRWDGSTWTDVTPTTGYSPGGFAGALAWSQGSALYLLGGRAIQLSAYGVPSVYYWHGMSQWNGSTWAPAAATNVPMVRSGAVAVDTVANEAVFFGTTTTGAEQTWTFDGVTWQQRSPAQQPPAGGVRSMAFDALRGRIVLSGGGGDTWEWTGATWLGVPTVGQPLAGSLVWDPDTQRVLLFVRDVVLGLPAGTTRSWSYDGVDWTPRPLDLGNAYIGEAIGGFAGGVLVTAGTRMQRYEPNAAGVTALGGACSIDAPNLGASRWPQLGAADFRIEATRAVPQGLVVLGGAPAQAPTAVLGCTSHVGLAPALVALVADPLGRAEVTVPLPAGPAWLGIALNFQGAALSTLAPYGVALTRGLQVRIGR